jgi:AcrR family transcriptional regulator
MTQDDAVVPPGPSQGETGRTDGANRPPKVPRAHNRHAALMAAAASVFRDQGYGLTTVRDIALATGMTTGAIYYHYPSKADLLRAVYEDAVRHANAAFEVAVAAAADPWDRLERAVAAHLEIMLGRTPGGPAFAGVFVKVQPHDFPAEHRAALTALRNGYEDRFRALIETLPLRRGVDRSLLRLHLVGSLNHVPIWYRVQGRLAPGTIARRIVGMLRVGVEAAPAGT